LAKSQQEPHITVNQPGVVVHVCHTSYVGDGTLEDEDLSPPLSKKCEILSEKITKNGG
jgi:hypothetical protein